MSTFLLACGAVGAFGFVVTFTVDGWTRPGYRPSYHPVSALSLGRRGWLQTANFLVAGAMIGAGAVGTAHATHAPGPLLLGVFAAGLIGSGVFPMDPIGGYPPGALDREGNPSVRNILHNWFGLIVFGSLPASCIAFAIALPNTGWTAYSFATAAMTAALFMAFGWASERDNVYTGLIQRATIVVGWLWIALLCVYLIE